MLDAGQVVTELQDMRDDGHLSDALLRFAVRQIAAADDRSSWTGVYLVTGEGDELWLHNYVGTPTVHAKIPIGTGICGKAVADRTNMNVADVSKEEAYLECSALVQSQLSILIRAGDDIFGQIAMESDDVGSYNEDDEIGLILVADKLAEQLAAERR